MIRRVKPEVVITNDPTTLWVDGSYINHPDHRAASMATVDAVFPAAGQPNLFEELADEGLTAHKVRKVYITWTTDPDTWVNVSGTIDKKIEALRAHTSQMRDWDPAPRVREWAGGDGQRQGDGLRRGVPHHHIGERRGLGKEPRRGAVGLLIGDW
ncbi:MAG: hypothetical protein R2854_11995 [Caldilineaceae bacterium]